MKRPRKLCRIMVFEGGRRRAHALWNPRLNSPTLLGTGSLYWPSPRDAWRRARLAIREPGVTQVKVETISGVPVGRLFADGRAYAEDAREAA